MDTFFCGPVLSLIGLRLELCLLRMITATAMERMRRLLLVPPLDGRARETGSSH